MGQGRDHNAPHAKMSTAKYNASKGVKRANHGQMKAHPSTMKDERPSQRIRHSTNREKAPEWARLKKDDHEKIPGTKIQCIRGGVAVRVIVADGTKFPPHKVLMAKRHIKKLAEKAREKAEIDKMVNCKEVQSIGGVGHGLVDQDADTSVVPPLPSVYSKPSSSSSVETVTKKGRKEAAWKERQEHLARVHALKVKEDGRVLLSQQLHQGEVVQRAQGKAWVKLHDAGAAQLPEQVRSRLQADATAIGAGGEVVAVCFADVADTSLDMKLGNLMQFKVFKDKHGFGGCEGRPLNAKRPANEELEAKSPKKLKAKTP